MSKWSQGTHSMLKEKDISNAERAVIERTFPGLLKVRPLPQDIYYKAGIAVYKLNSPRYIAKAVYCGLRNTVIVGGNNASLTKAFVLGMWGLGLDGFCQREVSDSWPECPSFMTPVFFENNEGHLELDFVDPDGGCWSEVVGDLVLPRYRDGGLIKAAELERFGVPVQNAQVFYVLKKFRSVLSVFYRR